MEQRPDADDEAPQPESQDPATGKNDISAINTALQAILSVVNDIQTAALHFENAGPLTPAGERYFAETIARHFANLNRTGDFWGRYVILGEIRKGNLSRKRAAEIMNAHQATIARWYQEWDELEAEAKAKTEKKD